MPQQQHVPGGLETATYVAVEYDVDVKARLAADGHSNVHYSLFVHLNHVIFDNQQSRAFSVWLELNFNY